MSKTDRKATLLGFIAAPADLYRVVTIDRTDDHGSYDAPPPQDLYTRERELFHAGLTPVVALAAFEPDGSLPEQILDIKAVTGTDIDGESTGGLQHDEPATLSVYDNDFVVGYEAAKAQVRWEVNLWVDLYTKPRSPEVLPPLMRDDRTWLHHDMVAEESGPGYFAFNIDVWHYPARCQHCKQHMEADMDQAKRLLGDHSVNRDAD